MTPHISRSSIRPSTYYLVGRCIWHGVMLSINIWGAHYFWQQYSDTGNLFAVFGAGCFVGGLVGSLFSIWVTLCTHTARRQGEDRLLEQVDEAQAIIKAIATGSTITARQINVPSNDDVH